MEPTPTDPGEPVADSATSLGEARADQIVRAGAPYPYSSPLPAAARDAHEQAAARAFSAYLKRGWFLGAPGFLMLFVPLARRSGPTP
ncbi:MAG: hypothetical protein JWP64_4399 [Pseudonocardia sp.]|jgi:hypothetical protein|uniref:hypothetical protein n=1 Tax=Pseudonocardia sp. TaxID=60912 RepID=UPI00260DBD9F|nr:hypothetical protein [Pseudonocardia sp.]MCU1629450.1 hypothetical protein [Pseudonocardia sp.]MDT7699699.1 hypothetical protein [Pseudonocardiales bacterium]